MVMIEIFGNVLLIYLLDFLNVALQTASFDANFFLYKNVQILQSIVAMTRRQSVFHSQHVYF